VDEQQIPVVIDFGLSKDFDPTYTTKTRLFGDPNRYPKSVWQQILDSGKNESWDPAELRKAIFPVVDLYQFGLSIMDVLATEAGHVLDPRVSRYLRLLSADLCKCDAPSAVGPTASVARTNDARALREQLAKLAGGPEWLREGISRRERSAPRVISRTRGSVEIRDSVAPLLAHPGLRRLQNLLQLSLLHYVFPSATQSRFDHCLSALGRAQELWHTLARDPVFLFHMDLNAINRLEIAALCHDLNHYPFLHYFQEAGVANLNKADILSGFLDITSDARNTDTTLRTALWQRGVSADYVAQLLKEVSPKEWPPEDQIIHSLINGGVDVDKLAYLPDDAHFTGVSFGRGVDMPGILSGACIEEVKTEAGKRFHLCFEEDALSAVESVCLARYWNFHRIYWHHTNRAVASMIIWTVRKLYSSPEESVHEYFERTRDIGEAAALEYLADRYRSKYDDEAPIRRLASNRDVAYKRIFEMSLVKRAELLQALQDEEHGGGRRVDLQLRILETVREFLRLSGSNATVAEKELLVDVPLRPLGLGGEIYIKRYGGESAVPAEEASPLLQILKTKFEEMSKTLRVFVAPHIRDLLQRSDKDGDGLREKIVNALPQPGKETQNR
jgi:HD superfamily phosphohydrolase